MTGTVQSDRLRPVLGTRDLAVYYISSLVGVGMLIAPGIALRAAGPASLVAWLLLTLAALPIAGVFARLSAAYPDSAGVSYLVRRAFGWRPGTTIGFLLLVLNWTGNPILGLAAVTGFLLGGGMPSVWATAGLALAAGYVLLRRPAEPKADPAADP
jgi:amino acid efflux transporter